MLPRRCARCRKGGKGDGGDRPCRGRYRGTASAIVAPVDVAAQHTRGGIVAVVVAARAAVGVIGRVPFWDMALLLSLLFSENEYRCIPCAMLIQFMCLSLNVC